MAAMLRLENDSDALDFRPEVAGNFASPASRAGEIVSGNQPKGQRPDQFPDANHDRACEVLSQAAGLCWLNFRPLRASGRAAPSNRAIGRQQDQSVHSAILRKSTVESLPALSATRIPI